MNRYGKPEIVGIASFKYGDCNTEHPSFWTNVASYYDWIQEKININSPKQTNFASDLSFPDDEGALNGAEISNIILSCILCIVMGVFGVVYYKMKKQIISTNEELELLKVGKNQNKNENESSFNNDKNATDDDDDYYEIYDEYDLPINRSISIDRIDLSQEYSQDIDDPEIEITFEGVESEYEQTYHQ